MERKLIAIRIQGKKLKDTLENSQEEARSPSGTKSAPSTTLPFTEPSKSHGMRGASRPVPTSEKPRDLRAPGEDASKRSYPTQAASLALNKSPKHIDQHVILLP